MLIDSIFCENHNLLESNRLHDYGFKFFLANILTACYSLSTLQGASIMRKNIIKKITTILILIVLIGIIPYPKETKLGATPTNNIYTRMGQASWYSRHDAGINKRTASNEIFNDSALTCAMWGVAFNRKIRVTNLANGKSIIVRVNDRGPHERFIRQGRVIDLTKGAYARLADTNTGLIHVLIEFL